MKTTRNFWPLGIIVTFVVFISGTIGLVVMACMHSTELVNSNYYDQEIKYQARIDSEARTQQTGANVSYDHTARHIVISLPTLQSAKDVTGQIQLYRPSAAGLDRAFKFEPAANGIQTLDAAGLQPGLWKIRVLWNVEGHDYFMDQKIIIAAS
ncbi:MAG TPA: FixH family protein [Verrucomicrobiae bacterium]|nr:FixH family protein [Verrucomicrobiae bacterium]